MENLPEFVGTVHIFLGPYRGNPIALYMGQDSSTYKISPRIYPWNRTVGTGENPNKAAADFEAKWKENGLAAEMYSGPHWEGGIKPEKPKPPPKPKPTAPKPEVKPEAASGAPSKAKPESKPEAASEAPSEAKPAPKPQSPTSTPPSAPPKPETPPTPPTPPEPPAPASDPPKESPPSTG